MALNLLVNWPASKDDAFMTFWIVHNKRRFHFILRIGFGLCLGSANLGYALDLGTAPSEAEQRDPRHVYNKESLEPLIQSFIRSQPFSENYSQYTHVMLGNLQGKHKAALYCEHEPTFFLAHSAQLSSRMTVGVECGHPKAWKLHLPLQVSILYPLLATTRPMNRGELFSHDNLTLKNADILAMRDGFFDKPEDIIGQLAKHPLPAGQVLTQRHLEAPKLVKRGDFVFITAKKSGLQVKMRGKSLADGTLGAKVKVENLNSKRIVEGVVTASQTVEIFL